MFKASINSIEASIISTKNPKPFLDPFLDPSTNLLNIAGDAGRRSITAIL
jgi:hypothetical protein